MNDDLERLELPEPAAWAATSEEGAIEALGFNQSRRFDTGLFTIRQLRAAILADRQARQGIKDSLIAAEPVAWVPVSDRLPEKGVLVLVYSPPQSGDWPDSIRFDFDFLDPDSDGDYWHNHGENYEHYCAVAKGGDVEWTGPQEHAPYTHWQLIQPPTATRAAPAEVSDAMVRRAVQATVDYIFNKAPAHEDVITARDNAMRAALEAALGGGE